MSETQSLLLSDGRSLCYTTFGVRRRPDQPTVFYFHGTPGSHHEGQPVHEAASKHGICVVAVSRPGYGGSTFQPNRTILSFPTDVLHLADHLGINRFAIIGISGGGPYVLACVHAIPAQRLAGAVVVSGMYPSQLGMDGMTILNRVLFNLAPWMTGLVTVLADWSMGSVARDTAHPEKYLQLMADAFEGRPAEDREVVHADDDRVLKLLVKSTREALVDGSQGFAWEARLFGSSWGFELGDLEVEKGKLVLWHGAKDVNVPVGMAEKAARMITNAELKVDENEAHVSLSARRIDEIAATVVDMLKA